MKIRPDSTEYATATVTTNHDITGATIEVAVPPTGIAASTWYPADVVDVVPQGDEWVATYRILVGPTGTVTLARGTYDWLVRITDSPEVPVRLAGTIIVG